MCFNSESPNWPSEPCSLGDACISRDSPPFKREYTAACLADPQAPRFLATPSASSLNLPEYTDRELVENHGLAAGLKLLRSLRKNGITDDGDIMAAFMGAASIAPELPCDEKQTSADQLSGFRPNAVNRPDMEQAFFYQKQLDARISPANAESRQGNTDNHPSQDQPMPSIWATYGWTSNVDEAMLDVDDQLPNPSFFDEALGFDPVGVRCISPERTVPSNTPKFEAPIPSIAITQPSTQVPRLAHDVIKRGVVALLHVEKWSKIFYDRFKEIAEGLDRFKEIAEGLDQLDIVQRLAIIFPDHVEWLARGQDVWDKVVKGVKVDTLPDILAFASLSCVISILRVEAGQIQQPQLLSDLHALQDFITNVNDRVVFTFLVDMWVQMDPGMCDSVRGMPIGSSLAEPPADSPAALSLRDTPLSLTVHAFFKQPEGFFFALSGRGKTLARGWETPRAVSSKAAKTLGKEFFGPLKKRMRKLGVAGTKYPKFCALLVVPKRLIVLGYLRTRVEVLEYLLALSMELLEPLEEQPNFASLIRGDGILAEDFLIDDTPGDDAYPSAQFMHGSLAMLPKGMETLDEVNQDPPAKRARVYDTPLARPATLSVDAGRRVENIPARHLNPGRSSTASTNPSTLSKHKKKDLGIIVPCGYQGCPYESHRRDQTRRHFQRNHRDQPLPSHLEVTGRGPTCGGGTSHSPS